MTQERKDEIGRLVDIYMRDRKNGEPEPPAFARERGTLDKVSDRIFSLTGEMVTVEELNLWVDHITWNIPY